MQTTKSPTNQRIWHRKFPMLFSACVALSGAPAIVQGVSPPPIAVIGEVVHQCSSGLLDALDGKGTSDEPGPDGTLPIPTSGFFVTSEAHADLAVASVLANKLPGKYRLRFCVVNRGGQPAYGPMTVQVRAGAKVILQETRFGVLPARGGNVCFGSNSTDWIPYSGPSLDGATISVTAAANEYSTRDNKCQINWPK